MGEIRIYGTPDYQRSVEDVLKTIKRNSVGNLIVAGIEASKKDLRIIPSHRGKAPGIQSATPRNGLTMRTTPPRTVSRAKGMMNPRGTPATRMILQPVATSVTRSIVIRRKVLALAATYTSFLSPTQTNSQLNS